MLYNNNSNFDHGSLTPVNTGLDDLSDNNADNADNVGDREMDDPFPIDTLPDHLKTLVEQICAARQAPQSLVGCCVLGTLSASLGAGIVIQTGNERFLRANLYIIGVAESGIGKGLAFSEVVGPYIELETTWIEHWRKEIRPDLVVKISVLKAELEQRVKQLNKVLGPAPDALVQALALLKAKQDQLESQCREPQWIVGDITTEKLAECLSKSPNESLASMSSEARGIIDVLTGRYSSKTDEALYLSAFSGDVCKIDRINGRHIRLVSPCLSILWLVQPDKMQEMLNLAALRDSGFLARFLMFDSKAQAPLEPENLPSIDSSLKQYWQSMLNWHLTRYFNSNNRPLEVSVAPEAAAIMREFRNSLVRRRNKGGDVCDIKSYVARWAEQTWKLALILHVVENLVEPWCVPLSAKSAKSAICLVEWFSRQQLKILNLKREKAYVERSKLLQKHLAVAADRQITLRDMERRHNFDAAEVEMLVQKYPQDLEIVELTKTGAGRPSRVVRLKPDILHPAG